jgi:hypothetical protein
VERFGRQPFTGNKNRRTQEEKDMTKRKRDVIVFSGIIAGCLIFLFWAIPTYTPEYPGYGVPAHLLPNITVSIMLVLSVSELLRLFLVYRAEKQKGQVTREEIPAKEKINLWHLIKFLIPSALLMPAVEWMGFIPAGILFMLVMQYLCRQRNPVIMILVTVVTVGIVYSGMRYGLQVPFP